MRNFIETVLRCSKCGRPLEIKIDSEIPDSIKRHKYDYPEGGRTGAEKYHNPIFVEPCTNCQEELERPARMILDGLEELNKRGETK